MSYQPNLSVHPPLSYSFWVLFFTGSSQGLDGFLSLDKLLSLFCPVAFLLAASVVLKGALHTRPVCYCHCYALMLIRDQTEV